MIPIPQSYNTYAAVVCTTPLELGDRVHSYFLSGKYGSIEEKPSNLSNDSVYTLLNILNTAQSDDGNQFN